VNLVIATANRDPLAVAHPSEIDLSVNRSHLSFGGGIHRCVGSHLARRELRLVVEEFHRRIPDYSIAGDVVPKVEWPSSGLHLESLPLTFRAVPTR
jgi:cytochrome P450